MKCTLFLQSSNYQEIIHNIQWNPASLEHPPEIPQVPSSIWSSSKSLQR